MVPRPRRLTVAAPGAAVAAGKGVDAELNVEAVPAVVNCGSWFSVDSMPTFECVSRASEPTETNGCLSA